MGSIAVSVGVTCLGLWGAGLCPVFVVDLVLAIAQPLSSGVNGVSIVIGLLADAPVSIAAVSVMRLVRGNLSTLSSPAGALISWCLGVFLTQVIRARNKCNVV